MEFSAGGIVFRKTDAAATIDFEFALILNSYDKWTFPKGKIEKKEKPQDTAIREVGEEIGVKDLRVVVLLDKIDYWYKAEDLIHKFVYFYLMEADKNSKLLPQIEEIKDVRWFDFYSASDILGYKKDDLPLLKKAYEILSKSKI